MKTPLGLISLSLALLAVFTQCGSSEDTRNRVPLFEGMGGHSMKIQDRSPLVQSYFDQGLILYYGYNFPEAARSFAEVARFDPDCPSGCWGEALSLGDCIEKKGDHWCVGTFKAINSAYDKREEVSGREKDLVLALAKRYTPESQEYATDHDAYIHEMKSLCRKYPDDPDLIALYVKAHMDNVDMMAGMDGKRPFGETKEILDALDYGLSIAPYHPGLLHFHIHALEYCGLSDQALDTAVKLDGLVPGSGHLQHMPAHIYFHVGRYHDATEANQRGIDADNALFAQGGEKNPEYAGFYLHNYYFLFSSLLMEGRSKDCVNEAYALVKRLKEGELPTTLYLRNVFYSVPYLVRARLGQWEELLHEPAPKEELEYAVNASLYGRGLALVHHRDLAGAEQTLEKMKNTRASFVRQNPGDALGDLMQITILDLSAAIDGAKGDRHGQLTKLTEAIDIEDGLRLSMLPWYMPMRQAMGDALLQAGMVDSAAQAFEDDLAKHPNNGWALYGLLQCREKSGDAVEAQLLEKRLAKSWKYADFPLKGARF